MPEFLVPYELRGTVRVYADDPAHARTVARETDRYILADNAEQVFITGDAEPTA